MNLDDSAVQRHCFNANTHELRALQLFEHPVQHTALAPAVHAGVERMPIAKALGQAAPLAAMLGHVQDGIEYGEVVQTDIATLHWQAVGNLIELGLGDLHAQDFASNIKSCLLVLTGPSSDGKPRSISVIQTDHVKCPIVGLG